MAAERGSVLIYILIAIALLAALTYSFAKDTSSNINTQLANKTSQELYVQVNLIRSAILECTLAYPSGGGDIDASGVIDATDNPNSPYPLNPYLGAAVHTNLTLATFTPSVGTSADNMARNVSCLVNTGSYPTTQQLIFQGSNSRGRFLPPPPAGWPEWMYANDTNGVRISIIAPASASAVTALSMLMSKFATCQADMNYGSCGARCFTAWIQRNACP